MSTTPILSYQESKLVMNVPSNSVNSPAVIALSNIVDGLNGDRMVNSLGMDLGVTLSLYPVELRQSISDLYVQFVSDAALIPGANLIQFGSEESKRLMQATCQIMADFTQNVPHDMSNEAFLHQIQLAFNKILDHLRDSI